MSRIALHLIGRSFEESHAVRNPVRITTDVTCLAPGEHIISTHDMEPGQHLIYTEHSFHAGEWQSSDSNAVSYLCSGDVGGPCGLEECWYALTSGHAYSNSNMRTRYLNRHVVCVAYSLSPALGGLV